MRELAIPFRGEFGGDFLRDSIEFGAYIHFFMNAPHCSILHQLSSPLLIFSLHLPMKTAVLSDQSLSHPNKRGPLCQMLPLFFVNSPIHF